jgi:hypothetical protein
MSRASPASPIRSTRSLTRAVLLDGIERFPAAYLDEHALEIRLLATTATR